MELTIHVANNITIGAGPGLLLWKSYICFNVYFVRIDVTKVYMDLLNKQFI